MNSYDPGASLPPADWLQIDEGERIELVASYHRRKKIRLPNAQLHAVVHVIVENQLALGLEGPVFDPLAARGESRHGLPTVRGA